MRLLPCVIGFLLLQQVFASSASPSAKTSVHIDDITDRLDVVLRALNDANVNRTKIHVDDDIMEYLEDLLESLVNINNSMISINKTVTKFQAILLQLEQNLLGNVTLLSGEFFSFGNVFANETFPLIDLVKTNFPSFLTTLGSVDTLSVTAKKDSNYRTIALISLIFFSIGAACLLLSTIIALVIGGFIIVEYSRYRNRLNINTYDIVDK